MADHARRSLHKVTYSSIRPSREDAESGAVAKRQRGLEKISFVSALRTSLDEIAAAAAADGKDPEAKAGFDAITDALKGGAKSRAGWRSIAAATPTALAAAGRALASYRRGARAQLFQLSQELITSHLEHVRSEAERAAGKSPDGLGGAGRTPRPPSDAVLAASSGPTTASTTLPPEAVVAPFPGVPSENPWKPDPTADPRLTAATLKSKLAVAIDWARVSSPERADALSAAARKHAGVDAAAFPGVSVVDWDRLSEAVLTGQDDEDWTDDLVDGFEERMKAEPVGRMHLERIDMTPDGVVRGELLHSVGLAPRETVTLIHREWSSRETSFEKLVSDEFEQSTEDGVTESTELASATEVQARHSSELSVDATASASYMFASASMTIGYGSSSEDESAKQESRNHSIGVTRKASARTRKEHKTTFTVKEQAGVEDQSVRTLSNPSETDPMRIDFHQLLRKWKVDLYRYGVRLTYDIVVPAPGLDLLANVDELRRIDHLLAQPFEFPLTPGAITRTNWPELAARYGAEVEPPPPETVQLRQQVFFPSVSEEEARTLRFEAFEFEVPDGYRIARGQFSAYFLLDVGGHFDVYDDPPWATQRTAGESLHVKGYFSGLENLHGRAGRVATVMSMHRLRSGYAQATLEAAPTADTWRSWQHAAWTAMRRAAEEQWQGKRHELRERRDQLGAAIGSWDPLSLRKLEREEIMKTTLKWIFGPAFDLMPSEMARLYSGDPGGVATIEPSRLTPQQWAQVMGIGEFIKYLQQAIEWENVLFFVYPYFWDNPRNHALKRFLNHPDSLHRAFLRGGAARVVLTVRPGFEESFTRLFETGSLDNELESDHPYLTIAQEIQAYAATHYPGIPGDSNDPEEVDRAQRGEHIAQWREYTPVSALDITVNTPLEQLK
jgi:hypothetical protein